MKENSCWVHILLIPCGYSIGILFDRSIMHAAVCPQKSPVSIQAVDPISLSLRETIDYTLEAKGSGFRLKLAQAAGAANGLSAAVVTELAEGIEYFHHASLLCDA